MHRVTITTKTNNQPIKNEDILRKAAQALNRDESLVSISKEHGEKCLKIIIPPQQTEDDTHILFLKLLKYEVIKTKDKKSGYYAVSFKNISNFLSQMEDNQNYANYKYYCASFNTLRSLIGNALPRNTYQILPEGIMFNLKQADAFMFEDLFNDATLKKYIVVKENQFFFPYSLLKLIPEETAKIYIQNIIKKTRPEAKNEEDKPTITAWTPDTVRQELSKIVSLNINHIGFKVNKLSLNNATARNLITLPAYLFETECLYAYLSSHNSHPTRIDNVILLDAEALIKFLYDAALPNSEWSQYYTAQVRLKSLLEKTGLVKLIYHNGYMLTYQGTKLVDPEQLQMVTYNLNEINETVVDSIARKVTVMARLATILKAASNACVMAVVNGDISYNLRAPGVYQSPLDLLIYDEEVHDKGYVFRVIRCASFINYSDELLDEFAIKMGQYAENADLCNQLRIKLSTLKKHNIKVGISDNGVHIICDTPNEVLCIKPICDILKVSQDPDSLFSFCFSPETYNKISDDQFEQAIRSTRSRLEMLNTFITLLTKHGDKLVHNMQGLVNVDGLIIDEAFFKFGLEKLVAIDKELCAPAVPMIAPEPESKVTPVTQPISSAKPVLSMQAAVRKIPKSDSGYSLAGNINLTNNNISKQPGKNNRDKTKKSGHPKLVKATKAPVKQTASTPQKSNERRKPIADAPREKLPAPAASIKAYGYDPRDIVARHADELINLPAHDNNAKPVEFTAHDGAIQAELRHLAHNQGWFDQANKNHFDMTEFNLVEYYSRKYACVRLFNAVYLRKEQNQDCAPITNNDDEARKIRSRLAHNPVPLTMLFKVCSILLDECHFERVANTVIAGQKIKEEKKISLLDKFGFLPKKDSSNIPDTIKRLLTDLEKLVTFYQKHKDKIESKAILANSSTATLFNNHTDFFAFEALSLEGCLVDLGIQCQRILKQGLENQFAELMPFLKECKKMRDVAYHINVHNQTNFNPISLLAAYELAVKGAALQKSNKGRF